MIEAVIFDLDGVIVDSETIWEDVRRALFAEHAIAYPEGATRAIMGMSAPEWSAYLHDVLGIPLSAEAINERVVAGVRAAYDVRLPLFDGAVDAVKRIAVRFPIAIASSSNRELIELVVARAGLATTFSAIVSAEEVGRGKPAPDVYLRAAANLAIAPTACGAVEDSSNGIRSAHAAGTFVVAVPNEHYPPAPDALALASRTIGRIADLDVATFASANEPDSTAVRSR